MKCYLHREKFFSCEMWLATVEFVLLAVDHAVLKSTVSTKLFVAI